MLGSIREQNIGVELTGVSEIVHKNRYNRKQKHTKTIERKTNATLNGYRHSRPESAPKRPSRWRLGGSTSYNPIAGLQLAT
jgi:UDP-N-acetylenolpyruvoylglucosamine reductase